MVIIPWSEFIVKNFLYFKRTCRITWMYCEPLSGQKEPILPHLAAGICISLYGENTGMNFAEFFSNGFHRHVCPECGIFFKVLTLINIQTIIFNLV